MHNNRPAAGQGAALRIPRWMGALAVGAALLAAVPAAAQGQLDQSDLVGKPEGITIITNQARWPTSFREAPSLAALVQAGRLPPVAQRLPQDLMVIQPVREIGRYGGT